MPVVSGRIVDTEGNPIANVLVSLDSYWANTRSDGRNRLEVPVGTYQNPARKPTNSFVG